MKHLFVIIVYLLYKLKWRKNMFEKLTNKEYKAYAEKACNNWKHFESFVCFESENREQWVIYNLENRDSGLLEQSNSDLIKKYFQENFPKTLENRWEICRSSHWGCGWVQSLDVKVYTPKKRITKEFKALCLIINHLETNEVLDQNYYEQNIRDATFQNVLSEGKQLLLEHGLADHVIHDVIRYWDDKDCWKTYNSDNDKGGWLSEEEIKEALINLKIISD